MAVSQATGRRCTVRAIGVAMVLCTLCAAPAAASPSSVATGDDSTTDFLKIPTAGLKTVAQPDADESMPAKRHVDDTTSPHPRLPPAIEAALQRAADAAPVLDYDTVMPPGITTRVPGVSDAVMTRYRKKMFRKDI